MTATLTEEQVEEVLGLFKGSHSVELKATVPETDIRSAAVQLRLDALEAEIRQVVFFDTAELTLSRAGVVVRARRIQGGGGDTVVKLRPVSPDDLPPEVRSSANLKVEVDVMPRGFVCSASMKGVSSAADVRSVILGEAPVRDLFSREQRQFYKAHAPEGLKLNDLAVLGPITLLKLQYEPAGFRRKLVAEVWLYPDGSRVLELSTKCTPGTAFQVAAETKIFLSHHGVDLTAEQQPKTNRALKYFATLHAKAQAEATAEASARPAHG